ncbi:hypothetical protein [Streptomyces sp. NPDC047028]|uniref:hypothetical protein n=1 Tax=Streptomyces sp. NPDC047028 TaxID=3155793 RepID=UPI0033FEC478
MSYFIDDALRDDAGESANRANWAYRIGEATGIGETTAPQRRRLRAALGEPLRR